MSNMIRKFATRLVAGLVLLFFIIGSAVLALAAALPDTFYTEAGKPFAIASMPWLSVGQQRGGVAPAGSATADKSQNITLELFGVLPVKTVRTVAEPRRSVNVCGTPFGVKMFSNGALVVAFSDRYTGLGTENPAKEAGLRLGDLIVSAAGNPVRTNEELSAVIAAAAGNPIEIVYRRGSTENTTTLTPVAERTTGEYRAGLWVRDSSAGVGTMTFVDPVRGTFAGLGHAISDTDTGADIALLSGEIVPVTITGCVGGAAGAPGELRGEFSAEAAGTVLANDTSGIYGSYTGAALGESCPVAQMQEVHTGAAEIWSTVLGQQAKPYEVRIERVNMTSSDPNRNLQLRVVDPELLAATGGIVRGMSGSPIVQDGKLVGAVTHVLVNDPARGYGIFAASMLEKADALETK